jgi:hypothetical protein
MTFRARSVKRSYMDETFLNGPNVRKKNRKLRNTCKFEICNHQFAMICLLSRANSYLEPAGPGESRGTMHPSLCVAVDFRSPGEF